MWFWMLAACGPAPMDADTIRELLDHPDGEVDATTMPQLADDLFGAGESLEAEDTAFWVKDDVAGRRSVIGDIFCVADLVSEIAAFDSCQEGQDCTVELTIDGCIVRMAGDEHADGKLTFTLSHSQDADGDHSSLELAFDRWRQSADEGLVGETHGVLAVEGFHAADGSQDELLYATDLRLRTIDPAEDGLFTNGVTWERHARAGMRLTTWSESATDGALLEVLAFVDPDGDGEADRAVVVELDAQHIDLGPTDVLDLEMGVRGTNGRFSCTFHAAVTDRGPDLTGYRASGTCVDEATGETFEWEGEQSVSN